MPTLERVSSSGRPLAGLSCCRRIADVRREVTPDGEPLLPEGHVLDGRYRLGAPIARSGMSTLYRAVDLKAEIEVAVKVPLIRIESDPSGFLRFRNEEALALELNHPSLLRVHRTVEDRMRPYLVMELLSGCTLSYLRDHEAIPEREALMLCALVCEAVGKMHHAGILHCDLQPSNIMLCCDQTLRVIDFGLARRVREKPGVGHRLVNVFGTPEYMAPEQVTRDPLSEATDVYGVGSILYELLTGSVPFPHENLHRSAFLRTRGDPVAPRSLAPRLSAQAEEIVLRALRREPSERYASMEAFAADLREPDRVKVIGLARTLKPPRWSFSLRETPLLAGSLLGLAGLGSLWGLFELLTHAALRR